MKTSLLHLSIPLLEITIKYMLSYFHRAAKNIEEKGVHLAWDLLGLRVGLFHDQ